MLEDDTFPTSQQEGALLSFPRPGYLHHLCSVWGSKCFALLIPTFKDLRLELVNIWTLQYNSL
jgi:hypothetical protein